MTVARCSLFPMALLLLLQLLLLRTAASLAKTAVRHDAERRRQNIDLSSIDGPTAHRLHPLPSSSSFEEDRWWKRQQRRALGSVTDALNGRWLEFRSRSMLPGSEVSPCNAADDGCSPVPSSQPLGGTNSQPWTFWATNHTVLTVIEGFYSGESIYHVWDRNESLGNTSLGQSGIQCDDDPVECNHDPKVGRGQWILEPGYHSLRITVEYQEYWGDYGWFRLSTNDTLLANVTTPSVNTTGTLPPRVCGNIKAPCSKGPTCCVGLKCRRRVKYPKGPKLCLKCVRLRRRCLSNRDCCQPKAPLASTNSTSVVATGNGNLSSSNGTSTAFSGRRRHVCRRVAATARPTCQNCLPLASRCLTNNDCCSRRCVGAALSSKRCAA